MGTVAAALTLIVGLLFAAAPADASKKRSKTDDAEMKDAFKKGRKRSASDPVLRRYGKKAEYVLLTSDYEDRSRKRSKPTKVAKAEKVAKPEKVAKRAKAKPERKAVEEEIVVIEDDEMPVKKKPAKKSPPKSDDNEITITEGW